MERLNKIQTTDRLDPIIDLAQNSRPNTLIIFDIDEVIIMPAPEDDLRHPARIEILSSLINKLDRHQMELYHSIILANKNSQLVDPTIEQLLELLNLRSIPTIGLTGMNTGKFGIIDSLENFRHNELKKFNISFAKLCPFPGLEKRLELNIAKIPHISNLSKGIPTLDRGIVFSAGLDKGPILEYLLNKYQYYPENIIFIDDLISNIHSIQDLCNRLRVNFQGFHYNASLKNPFVTIDLPLEKMRFKILLEKHLWLNYQELSKYQNN